MSPRLGIGAPVQVIKQELDGLLVREVRIAATVVLIERRHLGVAYADGRRELVEMRNCDLLGQLPPAAWEE